MSAFRDEFAADNFVKKYITATLEQAAHSHLLNSSDELVDYLTEPNRLDKACSDWLDHATNGALRELLKEHQKKYYQLHRHHAGAGQASSHNAAGPSPQRFGNHSESGYFSSDRDPGSPMSECLLPRQPPLHVFLVPAAVSDAEPVEVLARVDNESDDNIIDIDIAKSLCGDRIRDSQGVLIDYRLARDDQDGTNTRRIQCVVGRIPDANIVFSRDFGRSKPQTEPLEDGAELKQRTAEYMMLMAKAWAKEDMQKNRKRPPDDDDDGSQRLTQRARIGK